LARSGRGAERVPAPSQQLRRVGLHLWLGWFYRNYGHRPDAISPQHITEYLRTYTTPGASRAGFTYYRTITQDVADNTELPPLETPVLAVGVGVSWGRGPEVAQSLRRMATDVTEAIIRNCGHWVPDEHPRELDDRFRAFFTAPG
jgi:pimeloyl-ACP methyl ester carboxylesterase